jgi:hypothetical protein
MTEQSLHSKLVRIQSELKAPKGQKNTFGNYWYRSCEDILEAVKPLLKAEGLLLTISDDIVQMGERYYVRACVQVWDGELVEKVTAFAREAETKKGMDESQITGAASSYARKYALNGMFCIDDTKDADGMDNSDSTKKINVSAEDKVMETMDPPTGKQLIAIRGYLHQLRVDKDVRDKVVEQANTFTKASDVLAELKKKVENKKAAESNGKV